VVPPIITRREVDGLLVTGQGLSQDLVDRLSPIPCVWQGGVELERPIVDHILTNNRVIGLLAADYLLRHGCRRPAYLNHDPLHPSFRLRWNVFSEQLRRAGIEPLRFEPETAQSGDRYQRGSHAEAQSSQRQREVASDFGREASARNPMPSAFSAPLRDNLPSLTNRRMSAEQSADTDLGSVEASMWTATRLRPGLTEQVDRLLAAPERPDGLFVPTDQQAAMVWSLLRERGVTPGKDLLTISVNNDAMWLDTMHPRPATIDTGSEEMGRQAVLRLLARIEHPQSDPLVTMVTPKLVEGENEVISNQ